MPESLGTYSFCSLMAPGSYPARENLFTRQLRYSGSASSVTRVLSRNDVPKVVPAAHSDSVPLVLV
jgi:carboxylesterase type B